MCIVLHLLHPIDSYIMYSNHSTLSPETWTSLIVFVVYDCAKTARRLKETLDQANAEFDKMFEFDLRLWRLDILKLPQCREQVLQDLEDADLLTITLGSQHDSPAPPELNEILNLWNQKKKRHHLPLVPDNSLAPEIRTALGPLLRALGIQDHPDFFYANRTDSAS